MFISFQVVMGMIAVSLAAQLGTAPLIASISEGFPQSLLLVVL